MLKGFIEMDIKLCFISQMKQICKSVISNAVEQRHSVKKWVGKLSSWTPLAYSPLWHAADFMEKLFKN